MRDKSCKEQDAIRAGKIGGTEQESIVVKIITYMVQRHDDHYTASQKINRLYAAFTCRFSWGGHKS